MENVYFQLTNEFNTHHRIAILASGQAVVHYRLAMMSKDGDWIVRETGAACKRILEVLTRHRARYRAGAPLDPRWLAGGWSSHFEFTDPKGRRIRCDFFSHPPRVLPAALDAMFRESTSVRLPAVVDIPSLIRMKRTQRAKDYPVIGALGRLLAPQEELEVTTDPDRIVVLARASDSISARPAVQAALAGRGRLEVVKALAVEIDGFQQEDRRRLKAYNQAAEAYLRTLGRLERSELRLPGGHGRLYELAEALLPETVEAEGGFGDADVE